MRSVVPRLLAGIAVACLIAAVFWYTGRASTLDHAGVRSSTAQVASLRAEGGRLVQLVRDGDDLSRTTTVRANELADELDSVAGALGSAQVAPADHTDVMRTVRDAQQAARTLRALAAHPAHAGVKP